MKIMLCQNDIAGFLTAVYRGYYDCKDCEEIRSVSARRSLLDEYVEVERDEAAAKKVSDAIIKKGGGAFFDDVTLAYCSCDPKKETVIYAYLKEFFKRGRAVRGMYDLPAALDFNSVLSKTSRELTRLEEFIRFREMSNGVFYGFFSSDNDLLERVAPLFAERLGCQKFVLHDYIRKKLCYFDGSGMLFLPAPESVEIELSQNETAFKALWQSYHKAVSIEQRLNLNLQRAFAPKKYRHFMLEFDDSVFSDQ
ncbi:MAG: TIGR03915 family putative DNA repair protein [Clostridiales bacterium]|nr:TIGR03915 family putative DNA repair protein [Clostridiales bacterium]